MLEADRKFDAEVAVTIDREFSELTPFQIVVAAGDRELVSTDPVIFDLLEKYELLSRDPTQTRLSPRDLERLMHQANELYGMAEFYLGAEVLEVLLDGRVKVALLIDSDGGDMDVHNRLDRSVAYWRKGGGESQAFVYGHAHSAGFDTLMKADARYVLDKSSLIWHFSDSDGERRQSIEGLRQMSKIFRRNQQELAELRAFFELSPDFNEQIWTRMVTEIVALNNPDGDLFFSGKELQQMQLARSFKRLKSLFAKFRSEFYLADSLAVRDFWILSEVLDAQVRNNSDWQSLDFENMRSYEKDCTVFQAKRHYWSQRLRCREKRRLSGLLNLE